MTALDTQLGITPEQHLEIVQFLGYEAMLLDQNRLWEWFELLTDDYEYEVPIRVTRHRDAGDEFIAGAYHARDTKGSTKKRIERLYTGHAWAEDPASRVTRSIGSIYVSDRPAPDEYEVISSIIVYRERGLTPNHNLLCGQRSDVLRLGNGDGPRLARRVVRLAHTIINSPNLGVFL